MPRKCREQQNIKYQPRLNGPKKPIRWSKRPLLSISVFANLIGLFHAFLSADWLPHTAASSVRRVWSAPHKKNVSFRHRSLGQWANAQTTPAPSCPLIGRRSSHSLRAPIGSRFQTRRPFVPPMRLSRSSSRVCAPPPGLDLPAVSRTLHPSARTACLNIARCRRPGPERL